MKKSIILFIAIIFVFTVMSGCAPAPANSSAVVSNVTSTTDKIQNIPFEDGQLYAVAFVGYNDLTNLSYYLNSYIDNENIPTHYFSEGEYYLIVPRYSDMNLKLYKNDIETNTSDLIFEQNDCKPFLIQCNISDIFCDATVMLTYQGETVQFSPYLSLKDGSLEIGEQGLNITQ